MCRAFCEFNLPLTLSWMEFDLFQSHPSIWTLTLTRCGRIHDPPCYALGLITVPKLKIYFSGKANCINTCLDVANVNRDVPAHEWKVVGPSLPLATDFPHSVRDLYFGILAVSLGHVWHRASGERSRIRHHEHNYWNLAKSKALLDLS